MCSCNTIGYLFRLALSSSKQGCYRRMLCLYSHKPRFISYFPAVNFTNNCQLLTLNSLKQHNFCTVTVRYYAKGKDKPKSSKGKVVEIRDDEIADFTSVSKLREEMKNAVDTLKDEYIKQISLRSSTGAIELLPVVFEDKEYIIQDLAQINRKNPKVVALNLSLFPQTIPAVLDALNKSGMNLNPQQDGTSVYIPIPKVTKEHRANLSKNASSLFIKCKCKINDIQAFYIKKLESRKNEGMSIEQYRFVQNQIMAIGKSYIAQAEKMKNDKQTEILGES